MPRRVRKQLCIIAQLENVVHHNKISLAVTVHGFALPLQFALLSI